jgi:Transcriptional regulators
VLTGAERAASEAGATLLLLDSHYSAEREHLLVREMAAQRLAGLAIAPVARANRFGSGRNCGPAPRW